MFSGIIEATGTIVSIGKRKQGKVLQLNAGPLSKKLKKGDSLSVNGVCLTVASRKLNILSFDLSEETWRRSNLFMYQEQDRLNLELPVTANTMLSGHFVQGHVEGVGHIRKWNRNGDDVRLFIELPPELIRYCVPKGSIAINGVSLTIASLKRRTIVVALIPYTLQKTNLGSLKIGDPVNIETDVIGRYVVSALKKTYHIR